MREVKNTFYLLLLMFLVNYKPLYAQENEKPFIVSPLIGDTLSREERDHYRLFPTIDYYQWSVFFLNRDSTLDARVTYLKNSTLQDTLIKHYRTLKSLLIHLNSVEKPESMNPVKNENYQGNEVSVLCNNGAEISGELLSANLSSIIVYSPEDNMDCGKEVININCVKLAKTADIMKLTVKSDFNLAPYIYPVILGISAEVIYFQNNSRGVGNSLEGIGDRFLTGLGVGILGLITGVIFSYVVPLNITSGKEYINPLDEDDIEGLSSIARYKDFESYYHNFAK